MAKANPLRFSTKYQDDETDLLYYGYRYYNASTGRWLSRDPVAERGGLNLHAFCRNAAIELFDALGLQPAPYYVRKFVDGNFTWTTQEIDTPADPEHPGMNAWPPKWKVKVWIVGGHNEDMKGQLRMSCCFKVGAKGDGGVTFWAIDRPGSPTGHFDHEVHHSEITYGVWAEMASTIQSITGICMRHKAAKCYTTASPRLVSAYLNKSYLENARWHAYGGGYPPGSGRDANRKWVEKNGPGIEAEFSAALDAFNACGQL